MTDKVQIRRLSTGVPGLDKVLGGGLPEFSFNLIAGAPGAGKTMLAHQFMFHNAGDGCKALYFTIYGEPAVKMLRYQQQFSFFDAAKVNRDIRFVHLGEEMMTGGLPRVMERIRQELERDDARIVIVDSFRSVARGTSTTSGENAGLESFVQVLALTLTGYEATTFLVGEYLEQETNSNPVFTVADGIVWLYQTVVRNSVTRRLQVMKMRGQAQVPGLHSVRLSDHGMRIYPRLPAAERSGAPAEPPGPGDRKSTGVRGLDDMLGGGIPSGYSMLVAGPSGSGKTILATQFVLEGASRGEAAVIATFERRPEDYLKTSSSGQQLDRLIRENKVKMMYARPLDLSVDETLEELQEVVDGLQAKRVVIDSLSGFELALAPSFREDFRESLYRMVGALTALGVTVIMTIEVPDSFTELRLSPHGLSFLTDGVILQRYVEIDARLRRVMAVVKLHARPHSKDLREYQITGNGIEVAAGPFDTYRGILTGAPVATASVPAKTRKVLPPAKRSVKKKRRR